MAESIMSGLFGITPEAYQAEQNQQALAQSAQLAQLDPFASARTSLIYGGRQLGSAIGGALGAEDPMLRKISAQNQILQGLDITNPQSIASGIERAQQAGIPELAFKLLAVRDEAAAKLQAQQGLQLSQTAQQLLTQIKNPDGTINEGVKNQLMSFPQGRAAISELAKVIPDLRRIGAAGGQEENPFAVFINDPTIPSNVKTTAQQYSNSLKQGILDPEKVDARVKELSDMTQRVQQFEQNQQTIKAQQDMMNSFKAQGLQNSQQYLALAQSNNALAQRQADFTQQMKLDEVTRKREEAANKPLRADLAKDEEIDYKTASEARNLAIEANDYVNSIKAGNIKFGLKDRASIAARSAFGSNDPDVVARNDFERFKTRLVNESLRLNKGTQTEGDAQRSIKELQGAESEVDAAKAINTLAELNARKVSDAQKSIERRRTNAGAKQAEVPIEALIFEPQTFTQKDVDSLLPFGSFPTSPTLALAQFLHTSSRICCINPSILLVHKPSPLALALATFPSVTQSEFFQWLFYYCFALDRRQFWTLPLMHDSSC